MRHVNWVRSLLNVKKLWILSVLLFATESRDEMNPLCNFLLPALYLRSMNPRRTRISNLPAAEKYPFVSKILNRSNHCFSIFILLSRNLLHLSFAAPEFERAVPSGRLKKIRKTKKITRFIGLSFTRNCFAKKHFSFRFWSVYSTFVCDCVWQLWEIIGKDHHTN